MPVDFPSSAAEGQDGLNFANILRNCLSSGVLVIDDKQRISTLTPPAEQILGFKASEVLLNPMDLLPIPLQSIVRETLSTERPVVGREILLRAEERGGITVQVNSALTGGGNGQVSAVVLTLNDISSARKWESAMRRLDRLHSVGTLSASMAHEVKNAFVAIKTFVDLLLEKNQQADLAEIVRLEMGRIDSIIGQMLKFSGPAKPAFSHIRLHPVLDKSLLLIRHLLDEKKIKVIRAFAAVPDLLEADSDQLEQAFVNLFFNALDAMGENGRLAVSTELLPPGFKIAGLTNGKSKPLLRIVIQDSGMGIPSENMERLFEPFFTTKPDGTGLGLAITRRIIQEHRGGISVESENDKGTAFSIVLPASNIKR